VTGDSVPLAMWKGTDCYE